MCLFRRKNKKKIETPVTVTNPVTEPVVEEVNNNVKCYYGCYVPNSVETNNVIIINDTAIMSGMGMLEFEKVQAGIACNKSVYDEGNLFGPIIVAQKVVQTADFYNSLENVFKIVGNYLKSYSSSKQEKREEEDLNYASTLVMAQVTDKCFSGASGNFNLFKFDGYNLINDMYLEKSIDYLLGENNDFFTHEFELKNEDILVMTSLDFEMQNIINSVLNEKLPLDKANEKIYKNLKRTTKGITPFAYILIKKGA